MPERTATIASRVGLHARPASVFADDQALDASSILSLMSLGASCGDVVVLRAEGAGADQALIHLVGILETDHDVEA